MKKYFMLFFILTSAAAISFSFDFGVLLSGQLTEENSANKENDTDFKGRITFSPWFSVPLGEAAFFLSAVKRRVLPLNQTCQA